MFNPFRPWRHPVRLLRAGCRIAVSLPISIFAFVIVVVGLALSVGLIPVLLAGIPVMWALFAFSRGLGHVQRSKFAVFDGTRIADPVPPLRRPTWLGRIVERLRSTERWKEIAYHLVALPASAVSFSLASVAWCGSLTLALLPAYVNRMPGDSAKFYFFEVTNDGGVWLACALGVVGIVFVAPWVTLGLAAADRSMAVSLLGPSATAVFEAEREQLETRRSAAVDSAEGERRRIERDLHDGAQQRLVALAAELGAAKERLEHDPVCGREMVGRAHDEAKAALAELRDLVRGIHPVILDDRGLDAALSAVVARSPVPVGLDVQLTVRPPKHVESTAYFVVSEALTNIARHSQATRAKVSIANTANRLVVEVHDNGGGGADAARGTGLQGLRDRVAGAGGSMYVISPAGGPTTLLVELPCGS